MENQRMTVPFKNGELQIDHKTRMGDMAGLFILGNKYRALNSKPLIYVDKYLALDATKEFIEEVSKELGTPSVVRKKGKSGGTWAHLKVLLDAAMYMDAGFKSEVIDIFITNNILKWRDVAGEEFKQLNSQILICAEEVFGKPAHTGHYTNIAKIIRNRILPEEHLGWNFANSLQLTERARIENQIVAFLKMGVVRDWEHLKEIAEKI